MVQDKKWTKNEGEKTVEETKDGPKDI